MATALVVLVALGVLAWLVSLGAGVAVMAVVRVVRAEGPLHVSTLRLAAAPSPPVLG